MYRHGKETKLARDVLVWSQGNPSSYFPDMLK